MSTKLRKWTAPDGTKKQAWTIRISAKAPDGKLVEIRQNAAVNTRDDAKAEELELRRQIRDGTYSPRNAPAAPLAGKKTLAEFAITWQARNARECAHGTVLFYDLCLKHVLPQLGQFVLSEVRTVHVERFKEYLHSQNLAINTKNNVLASLRALLQYAERMGEFGEDRRAPTVDLLPKIKQKGKYLTAKQTAVLLAWVGANTPEWSIFFTVLLGTGLRIGEAIALEWRDIDMRGETLAVNRTYYRGQIDPAGSAQRTIPLEAEVRRALTGVPRRLDNPFVFPGAKFRRMTEASHRDVFERASTHMKASLGADEAGDRRGVEPYTRADNLSPHVLRHTFATRKVSEGVPLKVLSVLMGHASVLTTEIYARVTDEALRAAMGQTGAK